ncbi:MAG: two-component system, OmpR family, response regulator TctD [Gammaproteobacteria bacterium]|nr:two-component system, OmpR family, response regulator TctD [Gammaproteobacteria bacterium]
MHAAGFFNTSTPPKTGRIPRLHTTLATFHQADTECTMRVLIVEDDAALSRALAGALRGNGLLVDEVEEGRSAVRLALGQHYNVLVLDLGLPDIDGLDVLRQLRRAKCTTPVLILTARDAPSDRVKGLDLGADDYLAKPFDLGEFEARIRALNRRGQGLPDPTLSMGALVLNRSSAEAWVNGHRIDLRRREFAVLEALLIRQGKLILRERLITEIFGDDDPVTPNALEVQITRVRQKLKGSGVEIQSVRNLGYLLSTR